MQTVADHRVVADEQQVRAAIENLSDADLLRLQKAAVGYCAGTRFDPGDLLDEALLRTLRAARKERPGRSWPLDVPFKTFLKMTMKGLASDERDSWHNSNVQSVSDLLTEAADDEGFDLVAVGSDSCESRAIDQEERQREQAEARVVAQKVSFYFADDEQVTWIILGAEEDMSPREIQQAASMTAAEYLAARKRFRRGLEKILGPKAPQ